MASERSKTKKPTYEQDEGPLTERQMAIVAAITPQGRMKVLQDLRRLRRPLPGRYHFKRDDAQSRGCD